MTKSGISIDEALDTLALQTTSISFKEVITGIVKNVRNGQTLAESLKKYQKIFNHFYISLIEVGEESGTLEENLEFLAKQLAKEYSLRKKIQGALLYPTIVLTAMGITGMGLSLFILPKLVELFSSLDVPLPLSTKILLFFAGLMKDHGFVVIAVVLAIILFVRSLVELPQFKPLWHRIALGFPILGKFLQYQQLSTLCRNLGIMLKSGLTIKSALRIQYVITSNTVFNTYIARLQKSVDKGKGLEEELTSGGFYYISPVAVKMIGVGEKTGKLDEIFLYLGDFFEEEVDDIAKNLTVVLEPILLLVIGLIVGFVALAIISPIYQLTGSIKR